MLIFLFVLVVLIIESDRLITQSLRTQSSHQLHRGHLHKKGLSHPLAGGQSFPCHISKAYESL